MSNAGAETRPSVAASINPPADRADAVARARALALILRDGAAAADADRAVAARTIAAINEVGLFNITKPKMFGGSQLGLATLIEVSAEIASHCGSSGWLHGVLAGHNWLLALFPIEAQREVFADPRALTASVVRLGGVRPTRVAGGYRIRDARGKYCSGIDHSDWIILGAAVERDNGEIDPTYLLVPRTDVEVIDDWNTGGMRGTGSRSLAIADAFVPAHRGVRIADLSAGLAPGALFHDSPVYRAPFPQMLALTLAGTPLGLGRAGVRAFIDTFKSRLVGMPEEQIGEQGGFFMRIAEASAETDAAFALVIKDCLEIEAATDGNRLPREDRTRFMRDIAHAAWRCRTAVNNLYEASGGSGVYDGHPLQRIWRDINAAAAHNSFSRERAGGMYGRASLGLPASRFERIGH